LLKPKKKAQTIYRKPHQKVTKLKSKFYLFLGYLIEVLNNPVQEVHWSYAFRMA